MTKRAVLDTYMDFLDRMTDEVLDVIAEKAGSGLAGKAVRKSAQVVTKRLEEQMQEQGRILVEYTAARVEGRNGLDAYRREFLRTNPVYDRYEGEEEDELAEELLAHFDRAVADLEPLVASDADDFWEALTDEYSYQEAIEIIDRHFSQAQTFKDYKSDIFSSQRIGDLVIDVVETGEQRFRDHVRTELDQVYGKQTNE